MVNLNGWKPIAEAPIHGKGILVGFQGQFEWVMFIADANGENTFDDAHAPPTHFYSVEIPLPEGLEFEPSNRG